MAHLGRMLAVALPMCCGSVSAASLAGTEWQPERMGELAVPPESSAFIQFRSHGRLAGYSGCNRLMAQYRIQDSAIFIGPVAATRMSCAGTVMAREAALATALERARTFRRQRTELVLFDAAGQPILELRQTDWD
ncbi:MAG: META domain-containing protein [Chromatiaceae bacterium]|jgi:heat shock protein HslJ